MDRGAWQTTVLGVARESDMTLRLNNNSNLRIISSVFTYCVEHL